MPDFTPRDEISDWAIATSHAIVASRLEGRPLFPLITSARQPQAVWEVLITVARSVASILRPQGLTQPGPIGHEDATARAVIARSAPSRSDADVAQIVLTAGQLLGCAADEDFTMCRALAAAVLTTPDAIHRAHLVLRAMLEILSTTTIEPRPQEPS